MSAEHVIVLHGAVAPDAPPDEQDVLAEVHAVCQSLEHLGYRPQPMPVTLELQAARTRLDLERPAFVFNLVESLNGCGRFIHLPAAVLEELGLSYTGATLNGLFLSSNKLLAKRLLALDGIATPTWIAGKGSQPSASALRWIIKSVWEHASIGIDDNSIVRARDVDSILAARRNQFGGEWFAEAFIEGREFNIALIDSADGPQALPPAEIRFVDYPADKPRVVGYAAKWSTESFEYSHTLRSFDFADGEGPLLTELSDIAKHCWSLFECRGYARVDFRVDHAARPWVLEINANPCLSPDAGFTAAAAHAGLSYDDVIERIVSASQRKSHRRKDS